MQAVYNRLLCLFEVSMFARQMAPTDLLQQIHYFNEKLGSSLMLEKTQALLLVSPPGLHRVIKKL